MKSFEHQLPKLAEQQRDLEACELHILQQRAAARALREDPGARAYARQVANELAALIELYAHPNGQLTLADALDETLAEGLLSLALRHRHPLLAQPVTDAGYAALQRCVWEACDVLEHFVRTAGGVR